MNSNDNEVTQIKSKLIEIKSMLSVESTSKLKNLFPMFGLDPERLKGIKAPQAKPMLVLNNRGNENNSSVEKVINR